MKTNKFDKFNIMSYSIGIIVILSIIFYFINNKIPNINIRENYTTTEWSALKTDYDNLLNTNQTQVLNNYPILTQDNIKKIKSAFSSR